MLVSMYFTNISPNRHTHTRNMWHNFHHFVSHYPLNTQLNWFWWWFSYAPFAVNSPFPAIMFEKQIAVCYEWVKLPLFISFTGLTAKVFWFDVLFCQEICPSGAIRWTQMPNPHSVHLHLGLMFSACDVCWIIHCHVIFYPKQGYLHSHKTWLDDVNCYTG